MTIKDILVTLFIILAGIFMIGITLNSAFAATFSENISINNSQLPLITQTHLNITLAQNGTLFIDRLDNESRLAISLPNETFYGNSSSKIIDFNISANVTVTKNTTLTARFNLSSNISNITSIYSISVLVEYIPPPQPEPVQEEQHSFITIIDGNYVINVTTNVLPKMGEFTYKIGGKSGDTLNLTCPAGWLECPNKKLTFDSKDTLKFDIDYLVPLDAPLGKKEYQLNLSTVNVTRTTKIIFYINEPAITFASYQFGEECFVPVEGNDMFAIAMDCIKEKEEFDAMRLTRLWERMKALRNESPVCGCEPETVTEYVIAGDIEKNVLDDYQQCRDDRKKLNDDLDNCHSNVARVQTDRDKCQAQFINNESVCLADRFSQGVEQYNNAKEQDKVTNRKVWMFTGTFLFIVALSFGAIKFFKAKQRDGWNVL